MESILFEYRFILKIRIAVNKIGLIMNMFICGII